MKHAQDAILFFRFPILLIYGGGRLFVQFSPGDGELKKMAFFIDLHFPRVTVVFGEKYRSPPGETKNGFS